MAENPEKNPLYASQLKTNTGAKIIASTALNTAKTTRRISESMMNAIALRVQRFWSEVLVRTASNLRSIISLHNKTRELKAFSVVLYSVNLPHFR